MTNDVDPLFMCLLGICTSLEGLDFYLKVEGKLMKLEEWILIGIDPLVSG